MKEPSFILKSDDIAHLKETALRLTSEIPTKAWVSFGSLNDDYHDFYEPVSYIWNKFGYKTFYTFLGEENGLEVNEYGVILKIKTDAPARVYDARYKREYSWMSQISRMYAASFISGIMLLSDSDSMPLQSGYFDELVDNAKTKADISISRKHPYASNAKYCMMWLAAEGKVFESVFKSDVPFSEFASLYEKTYPKSFVSDEQFLTDAINNSGKTLIFMDYLPVVRVDRSAWRYDKKRLSEGYYTDSHLLRPFKTNELSIRTLMRDRFPDDSSLALPAWYDNWGVKTIDELSEIVEDLKTTDRFSYLCSTHLRVLQDVVSFSENKHVLEFGGGYFSTSLLLGISDTLTTVEQGQNVTASQNKEWSEKLATLYPKSEKWTYLVSPGGSDWKTLELPLPDIVMVDGFPSSRWESVQHFINKGVPIIVAHDTEQPAYNWHNIKNGGYTKIDFIGCPENKTSVWTNSSGIIEKLMLSPSYIIVSHTATTGGQAPTYNDNPASKITFYTSKFKSSNPKRQDEMDLCAKLNESLSFISVKYIEKQDRVTFKEMIDFINSQNPSDDDISVFGNNDIVLDETIKLALNMDEGDAFSLGRYDNIRVEGGKLNTSQKRMNDNPSSADIWIFRGRIKDIPDCNFGFGIWSCDCAFNERMARAGYKVFSPTRDIMTYHVHVSNHRTNQFPAAPTPYSRLKRIGLPWGVSNVKYSNKVVSFSLYGNRPIYIDGARRNIKDVKSMFGRDWKVHISFADDVINIEELKTLCDSYDVYPATGDSKGMLWRGFPSCAADVLLIRDIDAKISIREVGAVKEWLSSSKMGFLHFRDHPGQRQNVMAGLIGAKGVENTGLLKGAYKQILKENSEKTMQIGMDERELRRLLYPLIKDNCVEYTSQKPRCVYKEYRELPPRETDMDVIGDGINKYPYAFSREKMAPVMVSSPRNNPLLNIAKKWISDRPGSWFFLNEGETVPSDAFGLLLKFSESPHSKLSRNVLHIHLNMQELLTEEGRKKLALELIPTILFKTP